MYKILTRPYVEIEYRAFHCKRLWGCWRRLLIRHWLDDVILALFCALFLLATVCGVTVNACTHLIHHYWTVLCGTKGLGDMMWLVVPMVYAGRAVMRQQRSKQ